MNNLTAIILVDYFGYKDTKECLESLVKMKNQNFKVIIVNNTSGENAELSHDDFITHNAEIVESGENRGFSGGNNLGIKYAQEKYHPDFYMLLNNDTVVNENLLDQLIIGYNSEENVGLVTGKITRYPDTSKLWYAGGDYFEQICSTKMRGYGKIDDGSYDSPEYVGFAPGCLFFFPTFILDKIGYMQEDYFLYCEDTDYGFRIMASGLKLLYWPNAIVAHKESVSTGKGSPTHQYYYVRNKLVIISRFSKSILVKMRAYFAFSFMVWKDVIRGRRNFKYTADAYMDFFGKKLGKNIKYSKN